MKTSWRDLHIEQMATWPDAPRRVLLLMLASCVLLLGAIYAIAPLYAQWQQATTETQTLQQHYIAAAHKVALQKHSAATAQTLPVKNTQLPNWLADLATQAQAQGLQAIHISPSAIEAHKSSAAQPATSHSQLGQLTIKAEGDYAKLLQWWVSLAALPQVLSMEQIELTGADKDRVRGQVNVLFEQESLP